MHSLFLVFQKTSVHHKLYKGYQIVVKQILLLLIEHWIDTKLPHPDGYYLDRSKILSFQQYI